MAANTPIRRHFVSEVGLTSCRDTQRGVHSFVRLQHCIKVAPPAPAPAPAAPPAKTTIAGWTVGAPPWILLASQLSPGNLLSARPKEIGCHPVDSVSTQCYSRPRMHDTHSRKLTYGIQE
eukprot:8520701-Pyramimonas_sp.AAC.2